MTQNLVDPPEHAQFHPDRRTALRGALAVGVTGLVGTTLTGCGDDDDADDVGSAPNGSGGAGAAGTSLGPTADIPVGGGTIFTDAGVVVTQPKAGTFKAFSTTCTHEGCPVTSVAGGVIVCPCHGSEYSIADGSVKQAPAPSPLTAVPITTTDGTITIA